MAQTLNLDEYDGVCTVSGDGLIAEVLNGLATHADWHRAMRMPLAAIPAGSGNGLARTLEAYTLHTATLAAIRGEWLCGNAGRRSSATGT